MAPARWLSFLLALSLIPMAAIGCGDNHPGNNGDDGPQKPISIHQHVGQRPIFAAGNTNGDLPMLQWTAGNPHRTLQLVVNHTDAEREYAYDTDPMLGAGTDALLAAASEGKWSVVDMASDWATVFPPDA